jgi:hypothetical protein
VAARVRWVSVRRETGAELAGNQTTQYYATFYQLVNDMPQPVYTWQELAEHNKEGDALIAIHGKVISLVPPWLRSAVGGV